MKKRRLLTTLLVAFISVQGFALSGCGNTDENNDSNNTMMDPDMDSNNGTSNTSNGDTTPEEDMKEPVEDSDGDGIPDDEDPDPDDGPLADADGDGILNINEDADGDGDYTNDDTDGDGVPNWLDDTDDPIMEDMGTDDGGGMEPVEMEPDMEPDMGPDPNRDSDADGIPDVDEDTFCTDKYDVDTDGDTLTDYEEFQLGTDPCNKDTDGDGLDDDRENYFGFDPNNPSTIGNQTLDGDLFIVSACDIPEEEPTDFYKNSEGDWYIALPSAFGNYTELSITNNQPREAAAVFDDPANEVSGFVLSVDSTGQDPVQTLVSYRSGINTVSSIFQDLTEGEFDTHDGNAAAPGEYQVSASSRSANKLRDDLLFALAPFDATDVTNLPSSAGNQYNRFYIKISVIEREDRLITSVAVAPEQFYQTRDAVQFRMNDLTNTTNIAQAGDGEVLRCYPFPADTEVPGADFYWVLDQSGSMNADFQKVKSFASDFYSRLQNTALDFRLGVTNMEEGFGGRLRPTIGWMSGPNADITFSSEIQYYVVDCTSNFGFGQCSGGTEHGLYAAREGIKYMRSAAASPAEKIRPNAQLATIFMSDEEDQSVKNENDPDGTNYNNEQAVINAYKTFFAANPLAFAIVSPGGSCGEDSKGYRDVALASGGATASLCASRPSGNDQPDHRHRGGSRLNLPPPRHADFIDAACLSGGRHGHERYLGAAFTQQRL